MDNFWIIMDDLAFVDVKPDKGWFTWMNNREGNRELRDHLGRFLVLAFWLGCVPFFSSSVLRQTCSNYDAVLLDTLGRKLREEMRDPRLSFGLRQGWGASMRRRRMSGIRLRGPGFIGLKRGTRTPNLFMFGLSVEIKRRIEGLQDSIVKALKIGFGWQIGDGMTARFKVDRWGFEGLDGNSLWTSSNGSRDGLGSKQVCHRGGLRNETIIHALRDCPEAQAILSFGGLDGFLWNVWNGRNNALFWGKGDDARLVHPRFHRWIKPSNDAIKINVDAVILDSMVGIGIIVRDHNGFVLGCRLVFLDYKMNVEWPEAEALREGIIWARSNNVTRAFLDTD
ncbi:hypothetical protein Gotri_006128, partial [Gossypium trilobum]|nr:hypothetical protein [Gossypium trilobum]